MVDWIYVYGRLIVLDFAGVNYVKVTKNITLSAGEILDSAGEFSCTNQIEIHGLKAALGHTTIFFNALNCSQIEDHGGFLQVDVLLRGLLVLFEGVIPGEGHSVHMFLLTADGKPHP